MPLPFHVIIPARMASTRLPGKPLADIAGRPMVVRVAEQAQASGAARVIIATDDARIAAAAAACGIEALMTRADHRSGSDRLAEAVQRLDLPDAALVVNVQGDEPLIDPALIQGVAAHLDSHPDAMLSTACHRIDDWATFLNPNVVKVVADRAGYALYFSRAPIPYVRDGMAASSDWPATLEAWRHVGIYAYRAGFLRRYPTLSAGGAEQMESLEQLRVLDHGYRISVLQVEGVPAPGVDTPDDLARVRALVAAAR